MEISRYVWQKSDFAKWFEELTGWDLVEVLIKIERHEDLGERLEAEINLDKLWERWCKERGIYPIVAGAIEIGGFVGRHLGESQRLEGWQVDNNGSSADGLTSSSGAVDHIEGHSIRHVNGINSPDEHTAGYVDSKPPDQGHVD